MAFSEPLKAKIRRKSHHQCCLCKAIGVEVHHIIPQEEGGPDTEENAAPLCPSCHETYGANPQKRKFLREARDLWYEICEKRYASDADRLARIEDRITSTISYEDLDRFKEEFREQFLVHQLEAPRGESEIIEALDELLDKVWYNRHKNLECEINIGQKKIVEKETFPVVDHERRPVQRDVWEGAKQSAIRVEQKYGKESLGPWDDFEWGMLNGKLSALRWVFGDDWDILDT